MKKILLTLIISATIGIVHAQNVNIPDPIFKAVLVGNSAINTNGDSEIQVSEASAFGGTIFCASLGISDLTGIEAFTALTVLNCSSNLITSLDVSQNTALTSLNCSGDGYAQGQITNLDVSLNTALTEFYCFENQLDSLNVSQNSALTTLWCYENQLDSLDVSQNPALTTLWCSNNQLSSLDLSQNTSLGDLNCAFNQLTYLDVANGNNTNMSNFYANNNPNLFCIDVDDVAWSTNNWTNISAQTYFSTNCAVPPQTDYELAFNSATLDYVEMTNTSAVIANKTAFSMSCWVYPEEISPTNHGGIIGFRNNTDADFYLLQLQNTHNIEARFRNSSNITYDIIAVNALDTNQWQHLAFTYDGAYIRLYKNGIIVDSTVANGTIIQNTQSFMLGALDWQGSLFHLNGKLDEIRLWDVALSQTEINSWMCTPIDLTHPNYNNLMGYWRLNDGQGTIAYDQTANGNNGTLLGGTIWQVSSSCLAGSVLCGDVNEDGSVDQTDVTDISSFITGGVVPVFNLWAADVNCDGTINISDITILNSFISGTVSLNCCPTSTSPLTYVPDNNFEAYLENNGMGNGIQYDDSVFTSAIDTLTYLDVSMGAGSATGIFDLTGIEDFTALIDLRCAYNQLISLDLSQNTALTYLSCDSNQLTSLDVSANTTLTYLSCDYNQLISLDVSANTTLTTLHCYLNQLTSLDVSQNTALDSLLCYANQLTTLDVSQNTALDYLNCHNNNLTSLDVNGATALTYLACSQNQLTTLDVNGATALTTLTCNHNQLTSLDLSLQTFLIDLLCHNNQLTFLDIRNGNNTNITQFRFNASNNPNLYCINVDNVAWSTANWTQIDPQHYFSNNCSGTAIEEHTTNKRLLRTIDVLGRETKNQPFFYIYDDGTVEKKVFIE